MPDLPSGTVTFLFTDLEGSTLLWERHRGAMAAALSRHDALLRQAIAAHGGQVFKTVGDQFCAVFARVPDAIAAALDAQHALQAEAWEFPGGLRARMALHTGIAEERDGDYFGPTLNRVARILAAGHGGQVLLSQAVWELAADELPSGVEGRDLGERLLKDLKRPERLFQLVAPGLPADFPPPRTQPSTGRRGLAVLRSSRRATELAIASAAALVVGLGALLLLRHGQNRRAVEEETAASSSPAVAVLPFTVRGSGLDVWREGMVDLLSTNLGGVPGLRAVDSRTLLARWRESVSAGSTPDLTTALDVARRTGARYALVGSAVGFGSGVRFATEVYDLQGGESLGPSQVEGPADSVLALVDRLSIEILDVLLRGRGRGLPPINVARSTTTSLLALKAYLQGETWLRRSDFERAIPAYQRAVELDSTFALAYYRLATASGWTEVVERNTDRRHMERAARLADRLTGHDALLVRAKLALWRGRLDGLGPLREAAQEYPDDAEVWYLLGETSFHLGRQDLAGQDENDRAFARAIELDPGFAPAYIHLIENAFNYHADSALAARLVETYGKLTGGAESSGLNRLALALAFGDGAARASAHAALDSLSGTALLGVALHLWHPRFGAVQEEVLDAVRRKEQPEGSDAAILLFVNGLLRGRLKAALEDLDDPGVPAGYRAAGVYIPFMARLRVVSSKRLDAQLALDEADSLPYLTTFFAGAYAADRERWPEHATAIRRLRTAAQSTLARGDSVASRLTGGMATALEGYGLMKMGRDKEALPLLTGAQRDATAWGSLEVLNATIRYWLSRLLADQGDFPEARRYAASFWQDPLAAFSLAQIDEQLQEYDRARAAYEFFADSWRDADSDLQPLVEEARRAAARLGPKQP